MLKGTPCTNVGEDLLKLELMCWGNLNGVAAMENSLAVPQKTKQNYHMIQQFCY